MTTTPDGVAQQPARRSSKAGSGCLFVFALPFAAVGVLAGYQVVVSLLQPQHDAKDLAGLSVFALVFGAAGFGLMALAIHNVRHGDDVPEVERLYPNQPWMWRKDWASGRISDHSRSGVVGLWVFAVAWIAIAAPLAWMVLRNEADNKGAFFVLVFPLVGLGAVAAAIHRTLRHVRYGNSFFLLSPVPGEIGRTLCGSIETRFPQAPATVSVRLSAIRSVTSGTGKTRSTSEHVKWQDAVEIDGASLPMAANGCRIPVSFVIPSDAPETDNRNPSNTLDWRLEAGAELPGVDYAVRFDVPVFRTGAAPLSEEEVEAARDLRRADARSRAPLEPKVIVTTTPRGGTEFLFPPRRKLGSTVGAIAFLVVWFAFAIGLATFGAPLVFPAIFGLVGLLLLVAVIGGLLYVARLVVEPPTLTIRHSVLGFPLSSRTLQISEVDDVAAQITGQGSAAAWEVKVKTTGGQSFSAAALIPEQREAEWAAERIRQAIRS